MKKKPLRYIVILIFSIIMLLCSAFIFWKVIVNHAFVNDYEAGTYDIEAERKLLYLNVPESYTPYYNLGNAAYQKEDYNSAISYFNEALQGNPPEGKDCRIRINLALSLLGTIDFENLNSEGKIQGALEILYQARDILIEKGCAEEKGENGHDKDAQKLKDDIDKMIEKLEDSNRQNPDEEEPEQQKEQKNESDSREETQTEKEKKQQQALEKNKKNAMEERKEEIDDLDTYKRYTEGGYDEEEEDDVAHPW